MPVKSHRPVAWLTVFSLFAGLLWLPRGPELVCRITGAPMVPVYAAQEPASATCCDIQASAEGTGYTLSAPGCCDLRQGAARAKQFAAVVGGWQLPASALPPTVALPASPDSRVVVVAPRERTAPAIPRAPPRASRSPRAPPVFFRTSGPLA